MAKVLWRPTGLVNLSKPVLGSHRPTRSLPVNTLEEAVPDAAILPSFKPTQPTRVHRTHEWSHYDREMTAAISAVLRGRPNSLAAGRCGAITFHSASVTSLV
jgi:hypothetical protein